MSKRPRDPRASSSYGLIGWASIAQGAPQQHRRDDVAARRMAEAFRAVFMGQPTSADQQLVLAELAAYSRYFVSDVRDLSDTELRSWSGMRALFGRILNDLTLTDAQMLALMQATRAEVQASNELGDFV